MVNPADTSPTGSPKHTGTPQSTSLWRGSRLSAGQRADRQLCPVLVSEVLGLTVGDVAAAMRMAFVTRTLTLFQANAWIIAAERAPGWLAPLLDSADLRDPGRVSLIAARRRHMWAVQEEVWEAFGAGQRITGSEQVAVAARIAFESLTEMATTTGDSSGLGPNELAALTWAGVEPTDKSTWFVIDPDDSETVWFPRSDDGF